MKQIKTLEQNILDTLLKINQEFPELSKYIAEMPQNYLGMHKEKIDVKNLKAYYNSLNDLLLEYAKSHGTVRIRNGDATADFPGYARYPPAFDIFIKGKKEAALNPEDLSKMKSPNEEENNRKINT